jgi:retron-type reverse transcriptase
MRRAKRLFEQITVRENVLLAFRRAAGGRRHQAVVKAFAADLESSAGGLIAGLVRGDVEVGRFRQFLIRDPKVRVITAPDFSERVLHHAVMNVLEPLFDRWLIDDTYACRRGRGRERAVQRAQHFCVAGGWFLKLDVRKCFDSIPHQRLLQCLQRKLGDRRLLELLERIIRGFCGNPGMGVGLPIGSLTSQHFANFYLGWLDRFIKEQLLVRRYVRYMDDMVLWHDDRQTLNSLHARIREFAAVQMGLELKPAMVRATAGGVPFLGCHVYPTHTVLSRKSRVRWQRKLKLLHRAYRLGVLTERELQQRLTALTAFAKAASACSWQFRTRVIQQLSVNDP